MKVKAIADFRTHTLEWSGEIPDHIPKEQHANWIMRNIPERYMKFTEKDLGDDCKRST